MPSKNNLLPRGPQTSLVLDRRTVLQFFGVAGAAVALPGALAACSTSNDSDNSTADGVGTALTWAIGNGLSDLDSVTNFQAGNWSHTVNTYEAPMYITDDGTVEAALAESWEQPDARTVVLKIRKGVKFQDGTDLTAEDVAFSLGRNLDPKLGTGAGATYYGSVESIKATAADEVTVKLSAEDPLILLVLASPAAQVTSQAYFTNAGKKFGTPAFPGMGTGPYGYVSFDPASGYELEAHEDYWQGAPEVKKFSMKFIEDTQARLLAFQSGELDGTNDVPTNNLAPWEAAGTVQYLNGYFWYGWSFQVDAAPWNDINVRKTIAHATDNAGLNEATTGGRGTVAQGMVMPDLFAGLAEASAVEELYAGLPSYDFDMDKAAEALAASAYPDGFDAETTVPNSFPELKTIALNTAENLKALGIKLEVKEVPEEQIYPFWLNLPPDHTNGENNGLVCRLFPAVQLPDPADALGISLRSDQIQPGGQNSARFTNERVDELFETQRVAQDDATRFEALAEILTIAQEEMPYYGAFFGGNSEVVRKGIAYGNLNPYTFLKAWIPTIESA